MTQPGDTDGQNDAPTGVAPTELGAAIDETEAVTAWSLDDGDDEPPAPWWTARRITAAAVAGCAVAVAVAASFAVIHLRPEAPAPDLALAGPISAATAKPPPPMPSPDPPPVFPQLEGEDAQFVADMRSLGVPVSEDDPQWTVDMARAICSVAQDSAPSRYPPGMDTVIGLTEGVLKNSPGWDWRQASRFTNSAVALYCPDVRGPSPEEIAAMPPDDRYLAILQDKVGITPVDGSLIQAAHQVCEWKAQGWLADRIIDAINSPNPREDERVIVETATDVYCPQYRGR